MNIKTATITLKSVILLMLSLSSAPLLADNSSNGTDNNSTPSPQSSTPTLVPTLDLVLRKTSFDKYGNRLKEELEKQQQQSKDTANNADHLSINNLSELYQHALRHSPTIKNKQALLAASNTDIELVEAIYYPTFSLGYSIARYQDPNEISNNNSLSLKLTQYLNYFQTVAALKQSEYSIKVQQIELLKQRNQLILNIAKKWVAVLLAQANLKLSESEINYNQRQLNRAQQRFDVGSGKKSDLAEANAAYRLALATKIQRQADLTIANHDLEMLIGKPLQTIPSWQQQEQRINHRLITKDYDQVLKHNFEIQKQIHQINQTASNIDVQTANTYPELSAQLAYQDIYYPNKKPDLDPLSLTLNINWSFAWNKVTNIKKAQHLLMASKQLLSNIIQQQRLQLINYYSKIQASKERIPALKAQIEAREISVNAYEQGLQVGTETLPTVLNSRKLYQQAQLELIKTSYNQWVDYLNFKYISGQLSIKDLQE